MDDQQCLSRSLGLIKGLISVMNGEYNFEYLDPLKGKISGMDLVYMSFSITDFIRHGIRKEVTLPKRLAGGPETRAKIVQAIRTTEALDRLFEVTERTVTYRNGISRELRGAVEDCVAKKLIPPRLHVTRRQQ